MRGARALRRCASADGLRICSTSLTDYVLDDTSSNITYSPTFIPFTDSFIADYYNQTAQWVCHICYVDVY
jgi:hypothetical protein